MRIQRDAGLPPNEMPRPSAPSGESPKKAAANDDAKTAQVKRKVVVAQPAAQRGKADTAAPAQAAPTEEPSAPGLLELESRWR